MPGKMPGSLSLHTRLCKETPAGQKYTPQFEAIAKKYNLKLNSAWNKIKVSDVYHFGRHPANYHEFVLDGMRAADQGAAGNTAKFLQLFDQYVKQPLLQDLHMLNKTGW